MNWLQKTLLRQSQLQDEVFIDESGQVYGADGDIGPEDHDTTVLNLILGAAVEMDYEEDNYIYDRYESGTLTNQERQLIEESYPGFTSYQGLPKEYAVEHMGWIRVHGSNFQVGKLTPGIIDNIADYVYTETDGNMGATVAIEESSTGSFVQMSLSDMEDPQRAITIYRLKARQPSGLY